MQFLDLPFWEGAFRGLMALLCKFIYPVISFLYKLFINISQIRILESEQIQPIYQRITMILTIVMVFYITFQFVKYVVQPDTMTDKEKGAGNIVFKLIIVVILIAFVPKIFEMAYKIQHVIVKENVISKVIIGPQVTDETDLGRNFSATIFSMFYNVEEENKNKQCHNGMKCSDLVDLNMGELKSNNSLGSITIGLNATENEDSEMALINFDGLFAVLVGGAILYILALYSIDVGTRWAQLVYLQIISPIAILGYISPKKDGIFQKWTKQCLTTYLDLFLRIAIINISLLICDVLLKSFKDPNGKGNLLAGLGEISGFMETLIYIVLIMGVLMFAHKAPKLLAELFPKAGAASGNFGLSAKDRGFKGAGRVFGAAAGTAVGAVVGAGAGLAQGWRRRKSLNKDGTAKGVGAGIWGAAKGAVGGALGGAGRGLVNGGKKGNIIKNVSAGAKNQIKASQRFGNREENGYTLADQIGDRARSAVGARSRVEMKENEKAPIKRQNEIYDKIYKSNKAQRDEAKKHIVEEGKGRYSGEYKAAAQRVRDLKEDAATKAQFKVGKYKTKQEAYDAYIGAIKDARQSVNRQNFINPDGTFNISAYEEACNRAASKVKEEDFKNQVSKYRTQAEADEAYKKAMVDADKKLDEIEKKAINDFLDNGEWDETKINQDGTIGGYIGKDVKVQQLRNELKAEIEAYNEYASKDNAVEKINITTTGDIEITRINESTGQPETVIYNAKEFHDYAKAQAAKKSENDAKLTTIDADIEAIKRQTAGSGINEGKK